MRKRLIVLAIVLGGTLTVSLAADSGQKLRPTQPFMRHKLDYSRGILEGITLERFELVVTNATALRNMTVTNSFLMLGNEGYKVASTNFQLRVDALLDAAREKNLEGCTEAYTRVVRGCVECHHQYRIQQFKPQEK